MKISKVDNMVNLRGVTALRVAPIYQRCTEPLLRNANDRGNTRLAWLESHHTFSFGDYHDHAFPGFGVLRAINEDTLAAGAGFGTHFHQDLDIFTYVISGVLHHQDNLSRASTYLSAGQWQCLSAGSGVLHSERNASSTEPLSYLQFWIAPERAGGQPRYHHFTQDDCQHRGCWRAVANPSGQGALAIRQSVEVFSAVLERGQTLDYPVASERKRWVHVVRGSVCVNGLRLGQGDGIGFGLGAAVNLSGEAPAEVLLLDLPH